MVTYITIPDKSTTDTLTASEFNQLLDALKTGTITIKTESIEVSDDGYIKNENAYISAGAANALRISTNGYESNGSWVFPGATSGAIFQLEATGDISAFSHDGAGGFTERFRYNISDEQFEITGDLSVSGEINGQTIFNGASTNNVIILKSTDSESGIAFEDSDTVTQPNITCVGDDLKLRLNGNDRIYFHADGQVNMYDVYGDTVGATNRDLYIDNTGKIGYVSSSIKYKENIVDIEDAEWIYNLRPVTFDYKDTMKGINQMGLIAEEVEKVNPNIVSYNINSEGNKEIETVNYKELIIPLLKEVQTLRAELDEIKKDNPDRTDKQVEYVEQPDFKNIKIKKEEEVSE